MWLRSPGTNGLSNIRSKEISLDMTGLGKLELETYDIQYEKKVKVRDMYLRDVLSLFKPIPENVDVINLHTKSGMILPVSIGRLRKSYVPSSLHQSPTSSAGGESSPAIRRFDEESSSGRTRRKVSTSEKERSESETKAGV